MNAEETLQYSLIVSNVDKNVNGGYYRNGVAKTLVEKMDVATKWIEMSKDSENIPSIRALAKAAKVSRNFAAKVVDELKDGQIIDPKSLVKNIPRGKGSKSRRLDPQRLCLKNDDFFSPRFENTFRESIQTRIVRRWVASVEKFE
jgi:hypothetical protein